MRDVPSRKKVSLLTFRSRPPLNQRRDDDARSRLPDHPGRWFLPEASRMRSRTPSVAPRARCARSAGSRWWRRAAMSKTAGRALPSHPQNRIYARRRRLAREPRRRAAGAHSPGSRYGDEGSRARASAAQPGSRTSRFGSPLVLSRVHWVRPELDLKALLLRENQATFSREGPTDAMGRAARKWQLRRCI